MNEWKRLHIEEEKLERQNLWDSEASDADVPETEDVEIEHSPISITEDIVP